MPSTERRCTIVAVGLRGDAEPLMILGARLARLGVHVRCATHVDYVPLAAAHGLETTAIGGVASAFFGGPAGRAMRDRLSEPREFARFVDAYLAPYHAGLLREIHTAAADADLLVCWPWLRMATTLADVLRIPVAVASTYPAPYMATPSFSCPFGVDLRAPDDRATLRTWRALLPAVTIAQSTLDAFRREHGLAPLPWRTDLRRTRRLTHVFGYSTAVLPAPADWPATAHVTGYWFGSVEQAPPEHLRRFLDQGPPPVAIGFSSQAARQKGALTATVLEAVRRSSIRAVIVTGLSDMASQSWPDSVCVVPSVSYDWLFPRCAAVVHHGGSGSVGAALRAGVPSMAVPFGYDQRFWGERLQALGVGPAPIGVGALEAGALADALRSLIENSAYRANAEASGRAIGAEDGAGAAALRLRALLD